MLERAEREELQKRIENIYAEFQESRVDFLTRETAVEDRRLELRLEHHVELEECSNERKYKAALQRIYVEDGELVRLKAKLQEAEHDLERKKTNVEAIRLTVRLWGAPVPDHYDEGSKP